MKKTEHEKFKVFCNHRLTGMKPRIIQGEDEKPDYKVQVFFKVSFKSLKIDIPAKIDEIRGNSERLVLLKLEHVNPRI